MKNNEIMHFLAITLSFFLCSADQVPLLASPVTIHNCQESHLDTYSIERCSICQAGFTKSFDMLHCQLGDIFGCVWTSEWGCLECSCGLVVNYLMNGCENQIIEGCLRLDSTGKGCLQPKLGYTISYQLSSESQYMYLDMILDTGTYCGWRLNGSMSACSKCQIGFFLEESNNSCKKLPFKLKNEHSFYLSSNNITKPLETIQFIPGWDNWTGKTNAGGFPELIQHCVTYNSTEQYISKKLCEKCEPGYVRIKSQEECIPGHPLCAFVDDITHKCISCVHPEVYWIDIEAGICRLRNIFPIDNIESLDLTADAILKCSTNGYILDGTVCKKVDNCITSDGKTACILCQDNFYVFGEKSDQCGIILPSCAVMGNNNSNDISSHTCKECVPGFYLFDKICQRMPDNCKTMDTTAPNLADHTCQTCQPEFRKFNNFCLLNIQHCLTYKTDGVIGECEECQTMYLPSTENNRPTCILHTLKFQSRCMKTDGKGSCQQCLSLRQIPNCFEIPNSQLCLISDGISASCIRCLPTAYLVDKICHTAPSTCRRTDGNSSCKQCVSGYYVNTSNWCTLIPFCRVSLGLENTCIECVQGYTLTSNGCLPPPSNCSIPQAASTGVDCLQCKSGYKLESKVCQKIPHCAASNGQDSLCVQCEDYFQLSVDKLTCSEYDPNPILQPPQFCTVFIKESISSPTENPTVKMQPDFGSCIACESDRVPQWVPENKDISLAKVITQICQTPQDIGNTIQGCLVYHYLIGQCMRCQSNYYLVSGLCFENRNTPFCQFSPGLGADNICSVCKEGVVFQKSSQSCQLQVNFCQTREDKDVSSNCKVCNKNYVLTILPHSKVCLLDENLPCQAQFEFGGVGVCLYNPHGENCQAKVGSSCQTCNTGFKLIRDRNGNPYCLKDITVPDSQCVQYSPKGICIECTANHVLIRSTNNQVFTICASRNSQCTASNSSNTLCQTCSANYLDITKTTNGCVEIKNCKSPPQGQGFGCEQCDPKQGFALSLNNNFSCIQLKNCLQSVDGILPECFECKDLMYPSMEGVCVELTDTGCTASSGMNNQCEICSDLYYLDENLHICILGTVQNCIKYLPLLKPTTNKCALCQPGYFLNSEGNCSKIQNCKVSDGNSSEKCTSCEDTYYLNTTTGKCDFPIPYVLFCKRFEDNTKACIQCEDSYFLSEGGCLPRKNPHANCAVYTLDADTCKACQVAPLGGIIIENDKDSQISRNQCQKVTIFRCLSYIQNTQHCQVCQQKEDYQEGWLTQSQKFCKNVSAYHCLTISVDGNKCTSCQENIYFLEISSGMCLSVCPLMKSYYYVSKSSCVEYTAERIDHCQTPDLTQDLCQICEQTYVFDQNTNTCISMGIENCIDNGFPRGFKCLKCSPRYELTRSNSCRELGSEINNCKTYINNSSLCSLCNDGFYLSSNLLECVPITATNCLTHSHNADICLVCKDNTFTLSLDGKACFSGRDSTHCRISSNSSETSECFLCEATYISVAEKNNCILDDFNLPGCTKVAMISPNPFYTCAACKLNYSFLNGVCVPDQGLSTCRIENCKTYSAISFDYALCQACSEIQNSNSSFELIDNKCVFIR